MRSEQNADHGVYIDVFEQSILNENGRKKPFSFLASLSAELFVVSLLIIIPLTYSERLPVFRWRSVTMGPTRAVQLQRVVNQSTARTAAPSFSHPPLISNPVIAARDIAPVSAGPAILDTPPPSAIPSTDGPGPGPLVFDKAVIVKPPVAKPTPEPHPAAPSGPIRVSMGVQMAKLVKQVIPVYPPMARTARVSGVVHLVGTIAKDGTIRNLQVISGHPMLTRAALDAVSQWIYQPTLLSGEPVEVICPIDVDFKLGQ